MQTIDYIVPGPPLGQNRPRAVSFAGRARLYSDNKSTSARMDHISAFQTAYDGPVHEGPVSMTIICEHQIPKEFWANKHCKKKPDLDNVAKLILDGLNGVAYRDDSQVVSLSVMKTWSSSPCVRVQLRFTEAVEKPKRAKKAR